MRQNWYESRCSDSTTRRATVDLPLAEAPQTRMQPPYGSSVTGMPRSSTPNASCWLSGERVASRSCRDELGGELATPAPASPREHEIGRVADRGQRAADGRGALAELQERVVVLGVADADDVVRRDLELLERGHEPRRLVDAGRQDHDGAFVEDDLQLEAELADRFEHGRLVRLARRDDDLAGGERGDAALAQSGEQRRRRRLREPAPLLRRRAIEQRAVLGDDALEDREVRMDAHEIVELAARDEHEPAPRREHVLERGDGLGGYLAVGRERAVIVGCQQVVPHSSRP